MERSRALTVTLPHPGPAITRGAFTDNPSRLHLLLWYIWRMQRSLSSPLSLVTRSLLSHWRWGTATSDT